MLVRLVVAAFLLGHAMIHAGFLAPRPPLTATGPTWPFVLEQSWILDAFHVDREIGRLIGMALVAVTVAGLGIAAIATLGVGPASLWTAAVGVGSMGSLGVLLLFFNPMLVLGVGIDLALVWTVFVLGWVPIDATT
jgi:hypothetical protein